jgi:hypothetical protein
MDQQHHQFLLKFHDAAIPEHAFRGRFKNEPTLHFVDQPKEVGHYDTVLHNIKFSCLRTAFSRCIIQPYRGNSELQLNVDREIPGSPELVKDAPQQPKRSASYFVSGMSTDDKLGDALANALRAASRKLPEGAIPNVCFLFVSSRLIFSFLEAHILLFSYSVCNVFLKRCGLQILQFRGFRKGPASDPAHTSSFLCTEKGPFLIQSGHGAGAGG